jgi:hypothetical protein
MTHRAALAVDDHGQTIPLAILDGAAIQIAKHEFFLLVYEPIRVCEVNYSRFTGAKPTRPGDSRISRP